MSGHTAVTVHAMPRLGLGVASLRDNRSQVEYGSTNLLPHQCAKRRFDSWGRMYAWSNPKSCGHTEKVTYVLLQCRGCLYQTLESGSSPFSSCFGYLQKFRVSICHRGVSLCETLLVVCICRRISSLQGEFCNHQVKTAFWRTLILVQTSESLQVSLFSARSQDILTSAQMRRWVNPAELCFVCALSKMNCRDDKIFTLCPCQLCKLRLYSKLSEKCWIATAPWQVSAERQAATSLDTYWSPCQAGRGNASHAAPWTALGCFFFL